MTAKTCIFVATMCLFLYSKVNATPAANDIWIWPSAYLSMVDLVSESPVFVLQRHIDTKGRVSERGPSPWAWKIRELTIVFRFESRPQAKSVLYEFNLLRKKWESHGVRVVGLQLDYDSPTAKLNTYREDLKKILILLKREQPGQKLSITGLTDWLSLKDFDFNQEVTVYFQVYSGSREHLESEMNLAQLSRARFPFKIGVLPNQTLTPEQLLFLNKTNYFQGFAEFNGVPRS